MSRNLTIGSLFSGCGGLDMAASAFFGAETAWVSDIKPGACKVLAHRYPHAPNLGDITAIDWAAVEPVDIITGGSPGHERRGGARAGELLLKGTAKYELDAGRWGKYAAAVSRHEAAFGHPAPAPTEPGPSGNPRLSARFTEWMMGYPPGWITDTPGITRNEALSIAGDGVVPLQAFAALEVMWARIQETRTAA